jgi:hypothetical protein
MQMRRTDMSRKASSMPVPIIVAIISLIGVIITALVTYLVNKDTANDPTSIDYYKVRVVEQVNGGFVGNAKVTIELSGNMVPLDAITDTNGLAIITIPGEYMNKPGKLIVEAQGYKTFYKYVNLSRDSLPDVVQLEKN